MQKYGDPYFLIEMIFMSEKLDAGEIMSRLKATGITNTNSRNVTTAYAFRWACGEVFDQNKSSFKVVRARLRKIGIDIAKPYDGSLFEPWNGDIR
ncbi:phage/plasmid replication domain-containing protein [Pseudomonas syringae]|uniref:phage/plasmid replication domain-containing protein n=1 Tax=Pseudomonas syringae TaxID=317 RepID=UPI0008E97C81|nr:phage/plasmid replication protein [Pseudomonas syringae]SFO94336.1 Phage X family protein [Pseudomonas syringae]